LKKSDFRDYICPKLNPLATRSVLVCPLDWGIGHASRCIPLIRIFIEEGFRVVIAADGRPLAMLRKELPELSWIRLPGKKIIYPKGKSGFIFTLFRQLPGFLISIVHEHRILKKVLKSEHFDVVLSDNRYGLWNKECHTIFITHQLSPELPRYLKFAAPWVRKILYSFIHRYNECWIPDFENHCGLAGRLSHPSELPSNARYIGILSRFSMKSMMYDDIGDDFYEILVLLSGPEPQRTIFERKIIGQIENTLFKTVIVRGITEKEEVTKIGDNVTVYSHLGTRDLQKIIARSLVIICRSGYSTLMDLVSMGKRAVLIPTPGQTEQEYLARYHTDKKVFFSVKQEEFDLFYSLELSKNYPGMVVENDYKEVRELIKSEVRSQKSET